METRLQSPAAAPPGAASIPRLTAAAGPVRWGASSEDLRHGQVVIVAARWLLVAAGLLFALWGPISVVDLRLQLAVVLLLAVANFYLHAQLLMRRPALDGVVYAASLVDLALISLLVIQGGGLRSPLFVFYFPAVLAFAVAFPTVMTAAYAGGLLAAYGLIGAATAGSPTDLQTLVVRLLMLAAVAVCANYYFRLEAERRLTTTPAGGAAREAAEDIYFGQKVLIWARWSVVLAAAVLVLWGAGDVTALTVGIAPVIALMAINFYLHARFLLDRPANRSLLLLAALADLTIVTAMIALGPGQPGFDSPLFVLYYPLLAAFAFVFPPRLTAGGAALTLVAYVAACLLPAPDLVLRPELEPLTMRLLTLGAMGGLGACYWRVQRDRRRALTAGQPAPPTDHRPAESRPALDHA